MSFSLSLVATGQFKVTLSKLEFGILKVIANLEKLKYRKELMKEKNNFSLKT